MHHESVPKETALHKPRTELNKRKTLGFRETDGNRTSISIWLNVTARQALNFREAPKTIVAHKHLHENNPMDPVDSWILPRRAQEHTGASLGKLKTPAQLGANHFVLRCRTSDNPLRLLDHRDHFLGRFGLRWHLLQAARLIKSKTSKRPFKCLLVSSCFASC